MCIYFRKSFISAYWDLTFLTSHLLVSYRSSITLLEVSSFEQCLSQYCVVLWTIIIHLLIINIIKLTFNYYIKKQFFSHANIFLTEIFETEGKFIILENCKLSNIYNASSSKGLLITHKKHFEENS